ncbi:MAG: circadian clock KaiB family protein [Leptolyngbya sp.]|nr:circadian clock KaiB family protein [Leptolyngbya sp.]
MSKPSPDAAAAASFKGLALFTPGGDCVYCIDQRKHNHWHLDLCAALQTSLGLSEPPYFLLPCFTATVDRWIDPTSHEVITVAEAYPRALRFQTLLNILFNTENLVWQPNYSHHEDCSVWVIESYRTTFPQLWERHNLVMRVEATGVNPLTLGPDPTPDDLPLEAEAAYSSATDAPHLFKLFVSGADTAATEQMLRVLRNTLEATLTSPYTLHLIDVLTQPDQAEADLVTATPTLIQISPPPARRIVGQWPSAQQLRDLLG